MRIHKQLKLARLRSGLTQQELAKLAGVPENTISKLETGRIQPPAGMLRALRKCLCLPKLDLFSNELWETRQPKGGDNNEQ